VRGKVVSAILILLLLVIVFGEAWNVTTMGDPEIIRVPEDYPTIQAAINAAGSGDSIYVRNGTYKENVLINKAISLFGENSEATVIDGGNIGNVVRVIEDGVYVANFTIRNSGPGPDFNSGVALDHVRSCGIMNNNFSSNRWGILVFGSSGNQITNNKISSISSGLGVALGVAVMFSSFNNSISRNTVTQPNGYSIYMQSSCNKNILSFNKISSSNGEGIVLHDSHSNNITCNEISSSYRGLRLTISNENWVYHNSFKNNTIGGLDNGVGNYWDCGYPSGGNYWSDYVDIDEKRGPNQDQPGSDGIWDHPYVIDGSGQDAYPLVNPWTPWGDWHHYHSYTEIVNTIFYLNNIYPSIVYLSSIGRSWEGQDIYCIRLTNESNTHPKPKVLFVGYHHTREPISAELSLYFAVDAATHYGINATITRMLNYSEIYIVPALNVDGLNAIKQNEWQRKNVHPFDEDGDGLLDEDPPDDEDGDDYIEDLYFWNGTYYEFIRWEGIDNDTDGLLNEDWVGGVDINRNYGYQWNATCYSGSPYSWAEDYRGPAPFSEPETQAIRDLALRHDFEYAISFHSGAEVILYPWGYTNTPTLHNSLFREVAGNLSSLIGAPYQQSAQLYTTSGVWEDWMYGNRSTFALTCEIYTNESAWQYEPGPDPNTYWEKGVFQFFNPAPSQIEAIIQCWLPVFTYITNRAITEAYDIATTNMTPLKTVVGQGYSININVTVTNQGEFTETFSVIAYANTTQIETKEITLSSGDSTTLTLTWNTTGVAKGNYTVTAEATQLPGETDTTDNTQTDGWIIVAMIGDISSPLMPGVPDGKVDMADVGAVARLFGIAYPDPRYNPNYDITGPTTGQADGKIDMMDIGTVARRFGQVDP